MKLPHVLLAASLLANVGLAITFVAKPALAPSAFRGFLSRGATVAPVSSATPVPTAAKPAAPAPLAWTTLASDDLPTLVSRLRAAGFPPNLVRALVWAEINRRFSAQTRELIAPYMNQPYWKGDAMGVIFGNSQFSDKYSELMRARTKLAHEVLGGDFFAYGSGDPTVAQRRQFGDLPAAKIEMLQRILDDYSDIGSQARAGSQGITLPEDREKSALIDRERRADIAALLTPEELADYEMHTSMVVNRLRTPLTLMDATEDEFRTLYKIQQGYNDRIYGRSNTMTSYVPGGMMTIAGTDTNGVTAAQRNEAQQQMQADIKAALGDARYAEYQRASNSEFQQLNRLTQRYDVASDATVQAFNLRDRVSAESTRIVDDTALSAEQKRSALQVLAQNTRSQYVSLLGNDAGAAYGRLADRWLKPVENGSAVTFTPDGGTNMRRIPGLTPANPGRN